MSNNSISTIEAQPRKLAGSEAGQASGSQHHISNDDIETRESEERQKLIDGKLPIISMSLPEWLASLNLDPGALKETIPQPQIRKVPFKYRKDKDFEKYYQPRVFAIGPIHHGHPQFEYAENVKHKLAAGFIRYTGLDSKDVYDMIMRNLEVFKICYAVDVIKSYSNDELARMFLVDGCSILLFIYDVVNGGKLLTELRIREVQVAFIQRDIFLFENQLPYKLLRHLMSLISREANHLLDLLRTNLVTNFNHRRPSYVFFPYTFRNVRELIASGVELKPTGQICLDISFDNHLFMGTLKLPSLAVNDSTAPKLLNLIAYEMSPDFLNDLEVTSYVCFLDSLIDHPEDVQELRKAGILRNYLGSDEEVAAQFNIIGRDLVLNLDVYGHVTDAIEKHCSRKAIIFMAQAYHVYFGMPRTFIAFVCAFFIAFVCAFVGLFLTAAQTYFSWNSKKQ
ncbi:hypothetical protein JCGZ_22473 [Jatropha curcas]|uniref:Uncharacterized protein n=1 Tax=Jatropha curcas TaxID=180498 RepID=A0A067JQU6_JATCU|nr:hypothetical protein JCGZ_22473 [Jatropha curcas]